MGLRAGWLLLRRGSVMLGGVICGLVKSCSVQARWDLVGSAPLGWVPVPGPWPGEKGPRERP